MKLSSILPSNPTLCRFVAVRYIVAACSLSGCVPATAYEEVVSAAEIEREGHRLAAEKVSQMEDELTQTRAERDHLNSERQQLLARLQNEENQLAEVSLEKQNSSKATEQQQELVTQLRGELARVGQHIKSYEGQRSELAIQLEEKQAALLVKDQRITALEAEVLALRTNVGQANTAHEQLSGALAELAKLEQQVAEPQKLESTPRQAASSQPRSEDKGAAIVKKRSTDERATVEAETIEPDEPTEYIDAGGPDQIDSSVASDNSQQVEEVLPAQQQK